MPRHAPLRPLILCYGLAAAPILLLLGATFVGGYKIGQHHNPFSTRPKPTITHEIDAPYNYGADLDCPKGWRPDSTDVEMAFDKSSRTSRDVLRSAVHRTICRMETWDERQHPFVCDPKQHYDHCTQFQVNVSGMGLK